jgi:hypothetical protein
VDVADLIRSKILAAKITTLVNMYYIRSLSAWIRSTVPSDLMNNLFCTFLRRVIFFWAALMWEFQSGFGTFGFLPTISAIDFFSDWAPVIF